MEGFITEATTVLKQVVDNVSKLSNGLGEQKKQLDDLSLNVSQLKESIQFLLREAGHPVLTETSSSGGGEGEVVSNQQEEESVVVLNHKSVENDDDTNPDDDVEATDDDDEDEDANNKALNNIHDENDASSMDTADESVPISFSPAPSTEESSDDIIATPGPSNSINDKLGTSSSKSGSNKVQDLELVADKMEEDDDESKVESEAADDQTKNNEKDIVKPPVIKKNLVDSDDEPLSVKSSKSLSTKADKISKEVKQTRSSAKNTSKRTGQSPLKKSKIRDSDYDTDDSSFYLAKKKTKKTDQSPVKKSKTRNTDDDTDDSSFSERLSPPKDDDKTTSRKPNPQLDPKTDSKLDSKTTCIVRVTYLPEVILQRLRTHNFIIVAEDTDEPRPTRNRRVRNGDDEDSLTRAIKELCAFRPLRRATVQENVKSSKKSGKKRTKKEVEGTRTRIDGNTSDESVETLVVKKQPLSVPDELGKNLVGSDDEELDAPAVNSDSDESAAKKEVLKNSGKSVKLELSDADSDASGKKKTKSKSGNYYTPKVCRLSADKDSEASEHSSSDGEKVKKKKSKKTVIASDSDDDVKSCSSGASRSKNKNRKRKARRSSSSDVIAIDSDSDSDYIDEKNKRKKRTTKRNARSDSESDNKKQKRRKRIKRFSDDSDEDEDRKKEGKAKEEESDNGSGDGESRAAKRKNIHKIISTKEQQKQTREAQQEESKRKERVLERQKLFNSFQLPAGSDGSTDVIVENLVLDIDKTTKEPLISLDPAIVRKLKPHQAKGITFLWESCFESLEQYKQKNNEGSGCILAHCMGLGKTLQTIGFLHCVMTSDLLEIKSTLVICPLNTVGNWANEIKLWLRNVDKDVYLHKLYEGKNVEERVRALEVWQRRGGVGILGYDGFRSLVGEGKRINKKFQPRIKKCLLDPGPDIVVCDEAHIIKNSKSKVSLVINQIRTKIRILLTGTPLQNNLQEYHTMMQFVKPNLLGSLKEFRNRFVNPITNGQHRDSDERDVRIMKKRAHVLHKLLDGCVQRLDYSVLVPYLPPKYEYVLLIKLTDIQKKIYRHYLESIMECGESVANRIKQRKFLADFAILSKVWSHPYALCMRHNDNCDSDSEGSLKDFIDDDESNESDESKSSGSDSDVDWLDDQLETIKKKKKENGAPTEESQQASSAAIIEKGGDWWSQFFQSKDDMSLLEHGSKLVLLFEILKTCESIGDKVLIFSQSLNSLNIIENFLEDLDHEAKQSKSQPATFPPMPGCSQRWRKGIEYYRIDGSTKTQDRQRNCDNFNKTSLNTAKLFLISTRAGGLGINLVGANRVVIFDASWNPSQDLQSIFRVFRFGQTKPCYIYRFLAQGTMEEKVYNRQVVKLSLSGRVIDEHQIERHFKFDDILKMYDCDFEEKSDRPTPPVPKDRLLADLLISHKHILDTYLEHDSLLVNQADEGLTEEERQAAWTEYENEKDTEIRYQGASNIQVNANVDLDARVKQKILQMYPYLSAVELQRYFWKVSIEIASLRHGNENYMSRMGQLTQLEQAQMFELLQQKRATITRYLQEPNYLANVMAALEQQRVNAMFQSALPQGTFPQQDAIRVAPMSNILEPSVSNQFSNIAQNMLRNPVPQTYGQRTGILNRNRTIPTTTVPYNPSNNNDG